MHEIQFAQKVLKEAVEAGATEFVEVNIGELVEITAEELEEGLKKVASGKLDVEAEHTHMHEHGHDHDHTHDFDQKELDELGEKSKNWEFKVNKIESKIKCECGYEGRAEIMDRGHGYCLYTCPKCGFKPEVVDGGEIKIVEIR